MTPLYRLGLREIAARFRDGSLTPEALLEAVLARIAAVDPQLDSFVLVDAAGARSAARDSTARWTSGAAFGPLDGVPVGIKDVIDVAGMPTRCHSRTTSALPATENATIVAMLRSAGAVIVGKLATHDSRSAVRRSTCPFPRRAIRGIASIIPAGRRRARARRWRRGWCHCRSARIRRDRCAIRRALAGSSG